MLKDRRIHTAIATVVAAVTTSSAYAAGNHQVCYQGPNYNSQPTFVVQCRSDIPNVSCSISASAASSGLFVPPAGASTVRTYQGSVGTSYTASIAFSDGTQRSCTTSLAGYGYYGPAYANSGATVPQLTGYTTDESGLLMTGIWSSRTQNPQRVQKNTVAVPRDFVLVGGGALGAEYPSGALISTMVPAGDLEKRQWWVVTEDALTPQPHDNETYVIGMKIEGVSAYTLRNLVVWTSGSSTQEAHPHGEVLPPSGFEAVLGGGARSFTPYPYTGQFLTASSAIPAIYGFCWNGFCGESSGATGWAVESKDHGISAPGFVTPYISSMPTSIQVWTPAGTRTFRVETFGRGVVSGVAAHPSIVVAGRSGEFALTGVGAYVDWRNHGWAGNLLWKVVPRADVAGVEASSKDHAYSSPATITGYVVGVKLVP
jgi:hypothetical protein